MSTLCRSKGLDRAPVFVGFVSPVIGVWPFHVSATPSDKSQSNRSCIFLYTDQSLRLSVRGLCLGQSSSVKVNQSKSNQIRPSQSVPVRAERMLLGSWRGTGALPPAAYARKSVKPRQSKSK